MDQQSKNPLDANSLHIDLAGRSVRGGAVSIVSRVISGIAQFIALILLARLILPEAFGLMAMAWTAFALMNLFVDLGLSIATIQRTHITQAQVSLLFWINTGLGVVLALIAVGIAPLLAWFYEQPKLIDIVPWLAVSFVFTALTSQHVAILRRQMRFVCISALDLVSLLIGLSVAVWLAASNAGIWALVAQHLVTVLCKTVGAWLISGWHPSLPRATAGMRDLLSFGTNLTAFGVLNYFARTADNILIGWYWGPAALGLYSRAYRIFYMPLRLINQPLSQVGVPALSRLVDKPERYRRAYLTTLEYISMLLMPAGALLIVVGDLFVEVLLGPRWHDAGPILQVLAISLLQQPAANTSGWLFISQARSRELMAWGLVGSSLSVLSFVVGLPYGALGVAACYSISGLLIRLPLVLWWVGRSGPVGTADIYRAMTPSLIVCGVALVVGFSARALINLESLWPPLALVVLLAVTGSSVFIGLFALRQSRSAISDLFARFDLLRLSSLLSERSAARSRT